MIETNTFAAACYEQNSIAELEAALKCRRADRGDMKAWGISASEWRSQITTALKAKLAAKKHSA